MSDTFASTTADRAADRPMGVGGSIHHYKHLVNLVIASSGGGADDGQRWIDSLP